MKKTFSLMLVVFVMFNLCACSSSNTNQKIGFITKEELAQYCEYIDLTTENWNEYFEITKKDFTVTDVFDEEIGTQVNYYLCLRDGYYISKDNAVRITYDTDGWHDDKLHKWTDDIVFEDVMHKGDEFVVRGALLHSNKVGDITCEKIKGTILKFSLPEEKWMLDSEGRKYIEIKDGNDSTIIYYNYANVVYDTFVGK